MRFLSIFSILLFSLLLPLAANAGICQSYLLATDKIAALQEGIEELQKESKAAETRAWSAEQLQEIRDQGLHGRTDQELIDFYNERTSRSIERLRTEKNWYLAKKIIEEIKILHPEAKIDATASASQVHKILEMRLLETVSFEQIAALAEIYQIRKAALTDHSPESRKREQLLLDQYFPGVFKSKNVLNKVIWAYERLELDTCCGNSCATCPVQHRFMGTQPPAPRSAWTLPLFRLAPFFNGLIPETLEADRHNEREKKRLSAR